jgi:alginate O-acetyltransferase complex protein AlgI
MVPHGQLSLSPDVSAAFTRQAGLALALGLYTLLFPRDLVLGRVVQGRWSGVPLFVRTAAVASLPYVAVLVAAGSFSPFLYFRF